MEKDRGVIRGDESGLYKKGDWKYVDKPIGVRPSSTVNVPTSGSVVYIVVYCVVKGSEGGASIESSGAI